MNDQQKFALHYLRHNKKAQDKAIRAIRRLINGYLTNGLDGYPLCAYFRSRPSIGCLGCLGCPWVAFIGYACFHNPEFKTTCRSYPKNYPKEARHAIRRLLSWHHILMIYRKELNNDNPS